MSWQIVLQPNSLYSRFSEAVDDFTHMNLTRGMAWGLCRNDVGPRLADAKLLAADANHQFWIESLRVIGRVHGEERMHKRQENGSRPVAGPE
jgi:hypothetical protein